MCRLSDPETLLASRFMDSVISFFVIGLTLYGLALLYQAVSHDSIIRHSKRCQYCKKDCAEKVSDHAIRSCVYACLNDGIHDRPRAVPCVLVGWMEEKTKRRLLCLRLNKDSCSIRPITSLLFQNIFASYHTHIYLSIHLCIFKDNL